MFFIVINNNIDGFSCFLVTFLKVSHIFFYLLCIFSQKISFLAIKIYLYLFIWNHIFFFICIFINAKESLFINSISAFENNFCSNRYIYIIIYRKVHLNKCTKALRKRYSSSWNKLLNAYRYFWFFWIGAHCRLH